ncbi:MAG TPA: hypothetical protein VF011_11310 [Terriglobales bacterium]
MKTLTILLLALLTSAAAQSNPKLYLNTYGDDEAAFYMAQSLANAHAPYALVDSEENADLVLFVGSLRTKKRSGTQKAVGTAAIVGSSVAAGVGAGALSGWMLLRNPKYGNVSLYDRKAEKTILQFAVKNKNPMSKTTDEIARKMMGK